MIEKRYHWFKVQIIVNWRRIDYEIDNKVHLLFTDSHTCQRKQDIWFLLRKISRDSNMGFFIHKNVSNGNDEMSMVKYQINHSLQQLV